MGNDCGDCCRSGPGWHSPNNISAQQFGVAPSPYNRYGQIPANIGFNPNLPIAQRPNPVVIFMNMKSIQPFPPQPGPGPNNTFNN
jgi:hypothetical protein